MDGFPKLVQVLDSPRLGTLAVFADGMVAQYDHAIGIWRPATAHLSYEALFTEPMDVKRYVRTRWIDDPAGKLAITEYAPTKDGPWSQWQSDGPTPTVDAYVTLSPDVAVED